MGGSSSRPVALRFRRSPERAPYRIARSLPPKLPGEGIEDLPGSRFEPVLHLRRELVPLVRVDLHRLSLPFEHQGDRHVRRVSLFHIRCYPDGHGQPRLALRLDPIPWLVPDQFQALAQKRLVDLALVSHALVLRLGRNAVDPGASGTGAGQSDQGRQTPGHDEEHDPEGGQDRDRAPSNTVAKETVARPSAHDACQENERREPSDLEAREPEGSDLSDPEPGAGRAEARQTGEQPVRRGACLCSTTGRSGLYPFFTV